MTLPPGADAEDVRERLADGPEVGDVEILRKPGEPIERAAYDESKHERGSGDKGGQFVSQGSMGEHSGGRAGENKPAPPPSKKGPPNKGGGGGGGGGSRTRQKAGTNRRRVRTGPIKPVGGRRGPMKRGGDNDPEAVRQLQALLGVLGLGKPSLNGNFDQATEDAVKAAQERLGLKPTGRASSALLNKLITAHALSPCIKRSADGGEFALLRSALAAGDYDDDDEEMPTMDDSRPLEWGYSVTRAYPLEDISILRNGDGRTVEAYAAIWDTPAEVRDQHGHYTEVIARGAFDRAIGDLRPRDGRETWRVGVFYNHGFTIHGTPSELDSVPIGSPVDIRSDGRGLYTVTRFNNTDRAEQILESIRNGDISSYSFRGAVHESRPFKVPRRTAGQALPMVTRTRLGLTEYGPTPSAVYGGAAIMAVRSLDSLAYDLTMLDERERIELAEMIAPTVDRGHDYDDDNEETAAPEETGLGAEDLPAGGRSGRHQTDIARQIRAEQIRRGIK